MFERYASNTPSPLIFHVADQCHQDREAEPRFTGPPAAGRGGYDGGVGRGGFGGGFGGGMGAGGGGRQIYVSNVCYILLSPFVSVWMSSILT